VPVPLFLEGLETNIKVRYFESKCIGCGLCIASCKTKAIKSSFNRKKIKITIRKELCRNQSRNLECEKCVTVCPTGALALDGKIVTVPEVIDELLKDKIFYSNSDGGVTISGGEPLQQHQFNYEVLKELKKLEIHTAIETTLYASSSVIYKFIEVVDLFIVDLKIFEERKHFNIVGVSNEKIFKNFELLANSGSDILVRIPMIPTFTTSKTNIEAIADYVHKIRKDIAIELLNYNPLPISKYKLMDKNYIFTEDVLPFTEKEMDNFRKIISRKGIKIVKE